MPSPRTRRLMLDYEMLQKRFSRWPRIKITAGKGQPPELYNVVYGFKGLYINEQGQIAERHYHALEIDLSLEYPRRAPQCRMLTPVFHPNFDSASVCTGDFWAASEWLDDLVIRIGRMITYQEYNIHSPLNGMAAKWAAEHHDLLPVDSGHVGPPEEETVPRISLRPVAPLSPASEGSAKGGGPWAQRIRIRSL